MDDETVLIVDDEEMVLDVAFLDERGAFVDHRLGGRAGHCGQRAAGHVGEDGDPMQRGDPLDDALHAIRARSTRRPTTARAA